MFRADGGFYVKPLEFEAMVGCSCEASTGSSEMWACILREESMIAKNMGVILLEMMIGQVLLRIDKFPRRESIS